MIVLNFGFKELRFSLHAHSIILMNFLHVPGSIEGGFISSPNAFKQTFGLFSRYNSVVNPTWDVLCLGVFSV